MKNSKLIFPPGFLWGSATSSYQIEGGWSEDGKGESIWDRFAHTPGKIHDGSTGDIACDHYHRWNEDIQLMRQIGLQAYRFSISWPRILPNGRQYVNQAGLDFYSRLVDALLEAEITPFVTLYHWDLPQTLQDEGGWAARSTAQAFVEYTDVVSRYLGDRVKHWITHNEPSVAAFTGYYDGEHAPGLHDPLAALQASHHLLLSHGWAVPVIRQNCPQAEVGMALSTSFNQPASPSKPDRDDWRFGDGLWLRWFLDPLYGRHYPADIVAGMHQMGFLSPDGMTFIQPGDLDAIAIPTDFLGVNYYTRFLSRNQSVPETQNLPQTVFPAPKTPEFWTEMDWEIYPDGFFNVLTRLYLEYMVPKIYVTENGASYATAPDENGKIQDQLRINYIRSHLSAAHRATQAGVPLQGYFYWSLLDNFEWSRGFTQRFGIVWVDYTTQERILKDSAKFYTHVIQENAVTV